MSAGMEEGLESQQNSTSQAKPGRELRPRKAIAGGFVSDYDCIEEERKRKPRKRRKTTPGKSLKKPPGTCKFVEDDEDDEGVEYLWSPLPRAEASEIWPYRRYQEESRRTMSNPDPNACKVPAVAHFARVQVDGYEIAVNQTVVLKADSASEATHIAQVCEIFCTEDGRGWFQARWFWRFDETPLGKPIGDKYAAEQPDAKRVFLSDDVNDNLLKNIIRPANILRCSAKDPPMPDQVAKCDGYYDMQYHQQYTSFIDLPDCSHLPPEDHPELEYATQKATASANSKLSTDNVVPYRRRSSLQGPAADVPVLVAESGASNAAGTPAVEESNNNIIDAATTVITLSDSDDDLVVLETAPLVFKAKAEATIRSEQSMTSSVKVKLEDGGNNQATSPHHKPEVPMKSSAQNAATLHEPASAKCTLKVLELYCGCGGLSLGFQYSDKDTEISTRWAVDFNKLAAETFQAHHPETTVYNMKVEHFLSLCKRFHMLCQQYPLPTDRPDQKPIANNGPLVPGGNDLYINLEEATTNGNEQEVDNSDAVSDTSSGLEEDEWLVDAVLDMRIRERPSIKLPTSKQHKKMKPKPKPDEDVGEGEDDIIVLDDDIEDGDEDRTKGSNEGKPDEDCVEDREGVLEFLVKWKWKPGDNKGVPWEDSWEPEANLNCVEKIRDFVHRKRATGDIPLPGDVNMLLGGPPCQGISGHNRFRNFDYPLRDPKNYQLTVFLAFAYYFRPSFVLMENVPDLLKFGRTHKGEDGYLAKFAMQQFICMHYQVRLGLMAAVAYGVPQFRLRCFLWAAASGETLPAYPLPTHHVEKMRCHAPAKWVNNTVAYDECDDFESLMLHETVTLKESWTDLPPVENDEMRQEMQYLSPPMNDFQRMIRRHPPGVQGMSGYHNILYDHCPKKMHLDNLERVSYVPKGLRGANWEAFAGKQNPDKSYNGTTKLGNPLVPYFLCSDKNQTAKARAFGRVDEDDILSTVVTLADPHAQRICHPHQDRVLTVRECARSQGFPDYYKVHGKLIKDRYMQVGNAVAPPVARALCLALVMAMRGETKEPLCKLPNGIVWY
eukprot:jgi/Chlat1/1592/Chrsp124S01860